MSSNELTYIILAFGLFTSIILILLGYLNDRINELEIKFEELRKWESY